MESNEWGWWLGQGNHSVDEQNSRIGEVDMASLIEGLDVWAWIKKKSPGCPSGGDWSHKPM
jgi:hypothetical protein